MLKVEHNQRTFILPPPLALTKKKQVKHFWRRAIFQRRKLHSKYYALYQNLRENDREFHYRYLRMSKERLHYLLSLLCAKITKKNTLCARQLLLKNASWSPFVIWRQVWPRKLYLKVFGLEEQLRVILRIHNKGSSKIGRPSNCGGLRFVYTTNQSQLSANERTGCSS